MRRHLAPALLALATLLLLAPSPASAQYRHRGRGYNTGPAMTVYGPVYNPVMSPEYRLWASNPAAYERMMFMRQQQMMQKQQQAYTKEMERERKQFQGWLKDQQTRKSKGQPTDPAYDRLLRSQSPSPPPPLPPPPHPLRRPPPAGDEGRGEVTTGMRARADRLPNPRSISLKHPCSTTNSKIQARPCSDPSESPVAPSQGRRRDGG